MFITIFLNISLFIQLYLTLFKKNLDFFGLCFLFLILLYVGKHRFKGLNIRVKRTFIKLNEKIFLLLVLLNGTNLLTYLYSTGNDAKVYRTIEYIQVLIFILVAEIKVFRRYHKFLLPTYLIYLLIPPASVLLDSSSILNVSGLITIIAILIKLNYRKYSKSIEIKGFFIRSLFFVFTGGLIISGIINRFSFNLIEFIVLSFVLILCSISVSRLVRNPSSFFCILTAVYFTYTVKILYIAYSSLEYGARGGVNNNLIGITLEFLFLIGIFLFYNFQKSKTKYLILFVNVVLVVGLVRVTARTPFISITYGALFLLFYLLLRKKNYLKNMAYLLPFLHFFILGLFSYFLISLVNSEGVIIRVKLWSLGLSALLENPFHLLFGFGDFGKINLLQWVTKNNFVISNLNFNYDAGFFQTHLHSDFVAFLYGGGLFLFFWYLCLLFFLVRKLSNGDLNPRNLFCIFTILILSIHGLTEPIITNYYVSFIVWFCLFDLFNERKSLPTIPFAAKINPVKTFALFSIYLFLFSYNIANIGVFKSIMANPHFKTSLRGLGDKVTDTLLKSGEGRTLFDYHNYFQFYRNFPGSLGYLEAEADVLLFTGITGKNTEYVDRAVVLYCKLFELQPSPRHFNNIRNLMKTSESSPQLNCAKGTLASLYEYDLYGFIPRNFY